MAGGKKKHGKRSRKYSGSQLISPTQSQILKSFKRLILLKLATAKVNIWMQKVKILGKRICCKRKKKTSRIMVILVSDDALRGRPFDSEGRGGGASSFWK